MPYVDFTVDELRRQWHPTKMRLRTAERRASGSHPLALRIHRAFSWLAAAEKVCGNACLDSQLIFRWIALNALYGKWNPNLGTPEPDMESLWKLIQSIIELDKDGVIAECLSQHRGLVMAIFEDKYVNEYFWRTLFKNKSFSATRCRFLAQGWYQNREWSVLLQRLLDCIYLIRCQLVHGAATYDGKLNRRAVRHCGQMLDLITKSFLAVIIKRGLTSNLSWDHVCYPPVRQDQSAMGRS